MDFSDFEAVDISGQIPANFYSQMESKKWSDRKDALEIIEKATSVPKIKNADFSELVRILKKTIAKDTNIVVATLAAKCLCKLAQGLGTNFSPYANSSLTTIFDKFKEKKSNVISTFREAADAAFLGTNLECIFEDVIPLLDNKNPQIKSEICLFLARAFSRFPEQVLNKKTLRPLINALTKTLSDMDATVRDSSAQAIGTAMKVSGEKLMMTLIADVEPIKISKIKEFCEKAEIMTAPINGQSNGQEPVLVAQTNGVIENGDISDDQDDGDERIYAMLEAVDISTKIPANFYTQMESKKWSDRKEALDIIEKATAVPKIKNSDFNELVRVLRKTIAKDTNIVVATLAAKCLCQLAQGLRTNFAPYANSCLTTIFEKFKEKKPNVIAVLRDASDAVFVGTTLENIYEDAIPLLDNKNPQIKSELCLFLARVFANFPVQVLNKRTLRPLINALTKTLSDMDATVRDSAAMSIGTAMKVTGEKLMLTLIPDVEAIKIQKIKEFCEKAQVKKVPKSAFNACVNNAPAPVPTPAPITNNHVPPQPRASSATMIRSSSSKKLAAKTTLPKSNSSATSGPGSNATVKRTATIIKRSTVPKRASGIMGMQQTNMPPPAPVASIPVVTNHATPNRLGPPQLTQAQPQPALMPTPAKPTFNTMHTPKLPTRQESLDMIIFRLISDDHDEVISSLIELEESLSDDLENVYKGRINQIIDLACLQLSKSFDSIRTNAKEESHTIRLTKSADFLMKLFSRQQLVMVANQQSIRYLLVQLFTVTQNCNNLREDEDGVIRKKLNDLAATVMDSFEPSKMMCILSSLLNEPSPTSILEQIKDAIIRSMRSFK